MNKGYEKAKVKLEKARRKKIKEARERYTQSPNICPECKEIIPYEKRFTNKFCNSSCSAQFSNRIRKRKSYFCFGCGKQIDSFRRKYCTIECKTISTRNTYIKEWLEGKQSGLRGNSLSKHIRYWLFKTRGEKCEKCGWCETNPYTSKIPLQIDHINGEWKNNSPDNLMILCPSCHSLTKFYGSRNKGRGRPYRRSYYNR